MSGSAVSISANHTSAARRSRAVENTRPTVDSAGGSEKAPKIIVGNTEAGSLKAQPTTQNRRSRPLRKIPKPRWLVVIRNLTKILVLLDVLLGFMQMIRWVVFSSGHDTDGFSFISEDYVGKVAEVEKFLTTMQVQMNAVDRKFDEGISSVRKEFDKIIEKKGEEVDLKLNALDVRPDVFVKFINGLGAKSLLSKEEFGEIFEEFKKERKNRVVDGGEVSLDEMKDYVRHIVEKEIERHAADGLGMVDYALASGGARVVRHSEPYGSEKGGGDSGWLMNREKVSLGAVKMISPSFGEPGHCFPLQGSSGFVEIVLSTAVVLEAVTLEHVAKTVAYDRSTAPKQCRVSGWRQGQDLTDLEIDVNKFLLMEFTYDLDKSNAQIFKVVESAASTLVDTIRLDFTSNHGSASYTCIYRLRVHGHDPRKINTKEVLFD